MSRIPVALAVTLLLRALAIPSWSEAADVPVSYAVDDKALKAAISGTVLTFQLYSDSACTSLVHTATPTIDNVAIVSRLKRFKPKNGVKPPKTAELRTTLTGVSPSAATYLKVTGTGVTPVGGTCQTQSFTAPGGAGGGSLVMKDSNGTTMGPYDPTNGVILNDGGTLVGAVASPSGFPQGVALLYASVDCSGPPLISNVPGGFVQPMIGANGADLFYFPANGTLTTVNSVDNRPVLAANCTSPGQMFISPDRCCCTPPTCFTPSSFNVGQAGIIDVSPFVPPFTVVIQ